jgi:hypothetical protein
MALHSEQLETAMELAMQRQQLSGDHRGEEDHALITRERRDRSEFGRVTSGRTREFLYQPAERPCLNAIEHRQTQVRPSTNAEQRGVEACRL